MYQKIIDKLKNLAEPEFAIWLKPFLSFDDKSGEILLGIRVPKLRELAKIHKEISIDCLIKLLQSNCHEARELALFIMVLRAKKEAQLMSKIYLDNLKYINNWDLIDYTAPHIIAPNVNKEKLRELANSDYMWANRVAVVSTIYFIKQGDFSLTLELAEKFIEHPHHLMHKATGWMLREVGKKDKKVLLNFLEKNSTKMPSVMRSYAKECLRGKK